MTAFDAFDRSYGKKMSFAVEKVKLALAIGRVKEISSRVELYIHKDVMDLRMREAFRKSRIYLVENVIFDVLTDHLIDQDIFSDSMLDYIKSGTDRVEKIRRMLDNLIRRPNPCYQKFLNALSNSGHEHCALRIQENYVQSGPTQVSDPWAHNPTPHLPAATGIPNEDVPMENASCSSQENNTSQCQSYLAQNVARGFPEISSSMSAYAGSFTSTPVQESSSAGGEIAPSSYGGVLSPGEASSAEMTGMEHSEILPIDDGMQGMRPSNGHAVPSNGHAVPSNGHAVQSVYERHMMSHSGAVYKMDSFPRGLALVINNEHFKTMSPRTGSQRDMENLHELFKKLGFHVCHEKDKTAQEIRMLLESFAKYEPLQNADSLVVIILSHGGRNGIIFGRNGMQGREGPSDFITDEEIGDRFSARNCPLMANKPKLIMVQACRGENEDVADGVRPHFERHNNNNSNKSSLGNDGGSISSNTSMASSARIANMADICQIHSTVQGYVSYRHPIEGSPFIQEMTRVFQETADREHLTDMMTQVNRNLASRELQEDVRTVPSTTNTLTKKWFLNPPSI